MHRTRGMRSWGEEPGLLTNIMEQEGRETGENVGPRMEVLRNKWNGRRDKIWTEEGWEEQSANEPIRCRQLHPEVLCEEGTLFPDITYKTTTLARGALYV